MSEFVKEMQMALSGKHEPHYWGCVKCGVPVSRFSANVREYFAYPAYADVYGHLEADFEADGNCYDSSLDSITCDDCGAYSVKPWPVSALPEHVDVSELRKQDYVSEESLAAWLASLPEG